MKEKPILFSGPMVRAILEGRKTMTRRVVKFPSSKEKHDWWTVAHEIAPAEFIFWSGPNPPRKEVTTEIYEPGSGMKCPFGGPGQRLWVRETWSPDGDGGGVWYRAGIPEFVAGLETGQWLDYPYETAQTSTPLERTNWKPSIFMPRAASRILLEVTDVRVERLQEITEEDAIAEGVEPDVDAGYWKGYIFPGVYDSAKKSFASLWQSINGLGSWDQNPWVWVVSFKRIEQ